MGGGAEAPPPAGMAFFFSHESELLKHPGEKQKQLNFAQGLTCAEAASSSERVEIPLVGNQIAIFITMTVWVEHRWVLPAFRIQMNRFRVSKNDSIFGNAVAAECRILEG